MTFLRTIYHCNANNIIMTENIFLSYVVKKKYVDGSVASNFFSRCKISRQVKITKKKNHNGIFTIVIRSDYSRTDYRSPVIIFLLFFDNLTCTPIPI
jgi:hypothetical protein